MASTTITDEKIIRYIQKVHKNSIEESLIREEYLTGKNWEILEESTLQRIKEDPTDVFTIDALAHHYFNRKQYHEAVELYKQAVKIAPESASLQHHLAIGYYYLGDTARSLEEFRKIDIEQLNEERMYTIDWQEEEDYYYTNDELSGEFFEDDLEEAIQFTIKTLHHNAGMYTKMGLYDFAIDSYQHLLQLVPQAPCILNQLGVTYAFAGKFKQAKKVLIEAIQLNPGLEDAYLNLARTHSKLNEHELTVGVLKKACARFPDNCEVWLDLMLAYLRLAYLEKAIDCLVRALQADADNYFDIEAIPEIQPILKTAYEKFRGMN